MLQEMLEKLDLPALRSREEMFAMLEEQEYGKIPPKPENLRFTVEKEEAIPKFCAGKAICSRILMECTLGGKEYSFPFHITIPTKEGKFPFFVMPNFRPEIPDRHQPTEEIVDRGFAILSFCYKDVTSDDGDFSNGLAGVLYPDGIRHNPTDCGKISMWAWAAMRLMDYAQTRPELDLARGTVCGHSRLGKTALWTAANDPRFFAAYSNDSGCSGASIARETVGETIEAIVRRFPYWFCENYWKYCNNESSMPFDQHWLIALCAKQKVLIGSASKDQWADPKNEFLACVAASPAFEKGFVCEDRLTGDDETFMEGDLAYQIRPGLHYFSRTDWNRLCDFVELKSK